MSTKIKIFGISIIALLLVSCSARTDNNNDVVYSISDKYSDFQYSNITEIIILTGHGKRISIDNKDKIKKLFDICSKVQIMDEKQPKETKDGFSFILSFYEKDNKILSINASKGETVRINGILYKIVNKKIPEQLIEHTEFLLEENQTE